ncbi:MAG: hypothetical protein ACLRZN_04060 [Dialister invisus]
MKNSKNRQMQALRGAVKKSLEALTVWIARKCPMKRAPPYYFPKSR